MFRWKSPKVLNAKDISNVLKGTVPAWKESWDVEDWAAEVDWVSRCGGQKAQATLDRVHRLMAAADRLPAAAERLAQTAAGLDPSPVKAPPEAYEGAARNLRHVHKYFVEVAHRHEAPDEAAFIGQIDRMGIVLRALLAEAPPEEFAAIDQAIAEVEGG